MKQHKLADDWSCLPKISDLLKKFEPLICGEFLGNHGAGGIRLQKRGYKHMLGFWMSCCVINQLFLRGIGNHHKPPT